LTKFSEKLDSVKYSNYYSEFSDCIWNSEQAEEFDSKWLDLVERSELNDNKWLKKMFDLRSKWVPAHVNHVFSADMSSSQRAESSHAFFKRFVNKSLSLFDFIIQFGRGLAYQRHQELVADNKDKIETPKVILKHDFLLQMVHIYTCEIFFKFQDELIASLLRYQFELVKDDDNCVVYKVQKKKEAKYKVREILYDKDLDYAYCSCKKFESAGIPCRHLLAYFDKFHDYEYLPTKYILKRWKQGANDGNVVDNSGNMIRDDKEFLAKRREMVKFCLELTDKALESEEGTKIFYDAMGSALEKINQLNIHHESVEVFREERSPILTSTTHVFCEPSQVRAKGCGKRLKGGKEKALVRAKAKKYRMCHGCGKSGQTHDKRNCPALQNR
jgi:hypothetical protein